ncbi:MAG: DNA-methyltransferase [Woeseiaceae bacterium]
MSRRSVMINEWTIIEGDCRAALRDCTAESVQCVVTSPPYWGLRDYGVDGQIGLEPDVDQYISNLADVFDDVRRVLRDDGTLWLNLGDSYAGSWGNYGARSGQQRNRISTHWHRPAYERKDGRSTRPPTATCDTLKAKNLIGIPWRVAFELRHRGWWLRADNIWAKPNAMPESVRDRPMRSHEYVFLLTKSSRYFYDAVATVEACSDDTHSRAQNLRTVWSIPTQGFAGAHFATFPERLVDRCIRAGTSEIGSCPQCRAPWRRVVKRNRYAIRPGNNNKLDKSGMANRDAGRHCVDVETIGWEATCLEWCDRPRRCLAGRSPRDDQAVPCVVLDPFAGAATTGVVATRLGRSFVGVELSCEYAAMARHRIVADAPLFNT